MGTENSSNNNPADAPPPAERPDFRLSLSPDFGSRFLILNEIGHGAFSTVYAAKELILDRDVALKVLVPAAGEVQLQRFLNEAKASSLLKHPNIVELYSSGCDLDKPYIVMELLEGQNLQDLLRTEPTLSVERFSEIFFPVIDALIHAHSKQIIHRDLKPANIMITSQLGQTIIKVLDFGIAKFLDSDQNLTKSKTLLGTAYYMSPEQCSAQSADARSDIYSLACVMYEALSGHPPFTEDSPAQTLYAHLNTAPPVLTAKSGADKIPQALADTIMRALSKDPAQRPQTMEQFREQVSASLRSHRYLKQASAIPKSAVILGVVSIALLLIVGIGMTLVDNYHKQEKKKLSKQILRKKKLRVTTPEEVDKLLEQCDQLYAQRRYADALVKLEAFIPGSNSDLIIRIHDAKVANYRQMSNIRELEKLYKNALLFYKAPDDKYYFAYTDLIQLYEYDGKLPEAIVLMKQLCARAEKDPELAGNEKLGTLFGLYGRLESKNKQAALAEKLYRKSLKFFEDMPLKRRSIGGINTVILLFDFLNAEGKHIDAEKLLKSTIDQLEEPALWFDKTQCNAHQMLAEKLEKSGRYSEAAKVYQSALSNITAEQAETIGVGSSIPLFREAIARLKKKERERGD